jgi:hypothetical protein
MQWTWLTFPLVVALTCVGAYYFAIRLKGDALQWSQANVVDVDTTSGMVRGSAWLNLFSPAMDSFDLSMTPQYPENDLKEVQTRMAWLGLPGSGLGGMDPKAGDASLWSQPYEFSPSFDALIGVPVPVWSSKSLCLQWSATTKLFPQAELTDDSQLVTGSLVNTFDFPLENCILAYGRSVYELGTVAPGEAVRIGAMSKRSELKTLLTGRKVVFTSGGDKYQQEATAYDQSSADLPYILRMMMFYDAAGGRQYTGLWNTYQDFVDFSALLKSDRAILVAYPGKGKSAVAKAATLNRDGRPMVGDSTQVTVYRFVFQVKKEKGS